MKLSLLPGHAADRCPEGPLPGTQTHALAAAIKGTRGPRVRHLSGLARTTVFRRHRTLERFSSARAAIKIAMGYTSWNLAPAGAPWVLELYRVEWLVDGVWDPAGSILVVNEGEEILGPCAAVDQLASCRRPDLN